MRTRTLVALAAVGILLAFCRPVHAQWLNPSFEDGFTTVGGSDFPVNWTISLPPGGDSHVRTDVYQGGAGDVPNPPPAPGGSTFWGPIIGPHYLQLQPDSGTATAQSTSFTLTNPFNVSGFFGYDGRYGAGMVQVQIWQVGGIAPIFTPGLFVATGEPTGLAWTQWNQPLAPGSYYVKYAVTGDPRNSGFFDSRPVAVTPEPATLGLVGVGVVLAGLLRRGRKQRASA